MAFPCLGWLAAVSAAVICGLLASGTAAFINPIPIGDRGAVSVAPLPAGTVRVIAAGSMAGWQIVLIAIGAALAAAAAAVFVDRKLADRRGVTATTA